MSWVENEALRTIRIWRTDDTNPFHYTGYLRSDEEPAAQTPPAALQRIFYDVLTQAVGSAFGVGVVALAIGAWSVGIGQAFVLGSFAIAVGFSLSWGAAAAYQWYLNRSSNSPNILVALLVMSVPFFLVLGVAVALWTLWFG